MSAVSFFAGVVCALACLILLLPWLRTIPRLGTLPALPWSAGVGALVAIGVAVTLLQLHDAGPEVAPGVSSGASPAAKQSAWADVTDAAERGVARIDSAGSAPAAAGAGSMDAAIAALQARLAKGGGSNDDWELLAKSYEFLGRAQQASQARAHQLPALPEGAVQNGAQPSTAAAVSGEVTLAPALSARAAAGATVFIVAKSVDSPGAPVAVFRASVGHWPLAFTLDDSESMLPGHNLSSAGRVTIEARISQKGQPLAAAGDLQGVSSVINPRDRKPVKITIDKVIS